MMTHRVRMRLLVGFVYVSAWSTSACAQPAMGRPIVVLIHGRDQGKRLEADVKKEWLDAFSQGMKQASLPHLVPSSDVEFVWYGDIYADDGVDRTCPYVQAIPPPEQATRQELSDAVRRFLVSVVSKIPGLETKLADILVHDTEQYLSKANYRCATDQRLVKILDQAHSQNRPVILVAHSMGTLVSFSVLRRYDVSGGVPIVQFVTMGSQLGLNEVLRSLDGSHTSIPVKVPISIQRWANVDAKGDLMALRQKGFFDATKVEREPADVDVDNGSKTPHSSTLYLEQHVVTSTIARAYCAAFPSVAKPADCSKVH
jgi:hypothetical protein